MKSVSIARLVCMVAAVVAAVGAASPAKGAFHLWGITEVYTNSSGSLQFIEMSTTSAGQGFVGGLQVSVTNLGGTSTNMFTLPGGNLSGSTANRSLLFATAGLQAAGAPAPDYILPDGFLFQAGGSIGFFGTNGGPYTALPIDGIRSRLWNSMTDAVNSPRNYAGQTGTVPAPMSMVVVGAAGVVGLRRKRRLSA